MAFVLAGLLFVFVVFPLTALVLWLHDRQPRDPSLQKSVSRLKREHQKAVRAVRQAALEADEEHAAMMALKQKYLRDLDGLFTLKMGMDDDVQDNLGSPQ